MSAISSSTGGDNLLVNGHARVETLITSSRRRRGTVGGGAYTVIIGRTGNSNSSAPALCKKNVVNNKDATAEIKGIVVKNNIEKVSSTPTIVDKNVITEECGIDNLFDRAKLGKVGDEAVPVSKAGVVTCNMVAAMNEHLSSSSATSIAAKDNFKEHHHHHHQQLVNNYHRKNHQIKDNQDDKIIKEQDENDSGVIGNKAVVGIIGFPCEFDHMYASMTDGGAPATATSALDVVNPLRGNETNRQNDLTEINHLKELLLLHLDLIQQQSEQIVTKDKLLTVLRQENETLKLRLERMDRRVNLQKMRSDNNENSLDHMGPCSPPSLSTSLISLPSTSDTIKITQSESISPQYSESFKIRLNTSGGVTTVKQESPKKIIDYKPETMGESWENKKKRKSDPMSVTNSVGKRKRGVSTCSTVSNETTSTTPESHGGKGSTFENFKKFEKKSKSLNKRESFLTTEEHYYTAMGNPNFILNIKDRTIDNTSSNLEVPMWRVKVYTSCYTMEGTENLDDEIFNKRHLKLENDERRRKRWDVQRIREQRHIEKLKQRQEKQSHSSACYNLNHAGPCATPVVDEPITSLWPEIDHIHSIQVDDQLPVSAFGASIPSFSECDFDLPWLVNLKLKTRHPKRLNSKRKSRR